jgi:hypothetical protein
MLDILDLVLTLKKTAVQLLSIGAIGCPIYSPAYFSAKFADRHVEFWEWLTAVELGSKPRPFVAIWGRGGAKSTNAEAAAVWVGANDTRRYLWYISETQDQADEHVANIGAMLEASTVEVIIRD